MKKLEPNGGRATTEMYIIAKEADKYYRALFTTFDPDEQLVQDIANQELQTGRSRAPQALAEAAEESSELEQQTSRGRAPLARAEAAAPAAGRQRTHPPEGH